MSHEVFKTTGLYIQGAYVIGHLKPYYRYDRVDGAAKDPYYPDTLRDSNKHTLGVRVDPWTRLAVKLEVSHDQPSPGSAFSAAALQVAVTF